LRGRSLAGALCGTARVPGGLDLLRGSQIGLGKLHVFLRPGYLTFMSFQQSFVHPYLAVHPEPAALESAGGRAKPLPRFRWVSGVAVFGVVRPLL
jgi:hypothetical protein